MPISAYTGLPGHGKSYGVVENVIIPSLKAKRTIYSNIPMNEKECLEEFNMAPIYFDIEDIKTNENWWTEVFQSGSIIVLDELWRLWPSGLKANNVRDQDKAFLAEHRHMVGEDGRSTEIVFVTQDLSQIASFARALVETTFRVTKLSKVGLDKRFRVDVYFGPVTGHAPPISKRDREIHGKFKKSVYRFYKSHTKSETGLAGDETRTDKRFRALGSTYLIMILIFITACVLFVFYGSSSLGSYYGQTEKQQPTKIPSSGKPSLDQSLDKFSFLSKADSIHIVWNMGVFPRVDYKYRIVFDDSEVVLNNAQLAVLDYSVRPVSQCMVKISGPDFKGFALCERQTEQKGIIESMVSNPSNNNNSS